MIDLQRNQLPKQDSATVRQRLPEELDIVEFLNQGYVCPRNAGQSWRAAHEAGVDMGMVEDSLLMQPGERLRQHQGALNQILAMRQGRHSHDSGS